jgi:hypothetical protein
LLLAIPGLEIDCEVAHGYAKSCIPFQVAFDQRRLVGAVLNPSTNRLSVAVDHRMVALELSEVSRPATKQ